MLVLSDDKLSAFSTIKKNDGSAAITSLTTLSHFLNLASIRLPLGC